MAARRPAGRIRARVWPASMRARSEGSPRACGVGLAAAFLISVWGARGPGVLGPESAFLVTGLAILAVAIALVYLFITRGHPFTRSQVQGARLEGLAPDVQKAVVEVQTVSRQPAADGAGRRDHGMRSDDASAPRTPREWIPGSAPLQRRRMRGREGRNLCSPLGSTTRPPNSSCASAFPTEIPWRRRVPARSWKAARRATRTGRPMERADHRQGERAELDRGDATAACAACPERADRGMIRPLRRRGVPSGRRPGRRPSSRTSRRASGLAVEAGRSARASPLPGGRRA